MPRAKVQYFSPPRPYTKRQTVKAKCKNAYKSREAKLQKKNNKDIDACLQSVLKRFGSYLLSTRNPLPKTRFITLEP